MVYVLFGRDLSAYSDSVKMAVWSKCEGSGVLSAVVVVDYVCSLSGNMDAYK